MGTGEVSTAEELVQELMAILNIEDLDQCIYEVAEQRAKAYLEQARSEGYERGFEDGRDDAARGY